MTSVRKVTVKEDKDEYKKRKERTEIDKRRMIILLVKSLKHTKGMRWIER